MSDRTFYLKESCLPFIEAKKKNPRLCINLYLFVQITSSNLSRQICIPRSLIIFSSWIISNNMSYFLKVFVISMMTTHVLITRAMISDPQTQTQNLNQPQTASLPPSPLNPKGDAGLSSYQLGSHQPVFSKLEPNKTVNCRYEYALYYSQAQDGTSIPYVRRFKFHSSSFFNHFSLHIKFIEFPPCWWYVGCMDNDYSIWDCPQNTCRGTVKKCLKRC